MAREGALVLVLALALLTPGAARRKDTGPCGADKACSRKGRCVETLGDESCLCESGYAGALCEIECPGLTDDGVYCSGFGSCSKDGACRCDDGYSGQFCEVGSVMTPPARRRGRKVSPERDASQERAGTEREEDTESRRRNLGPGAIAEEGQHARATSEESAARGGILKGSAGVRENNLGTDTLVRNHAQDREGSDTQGRKERTSRATSDVGKGGRAEDVAQHGSAKGTRAEQRQSSRRERGNRRRAKTSAVMREWRRKADVENQNSLEAKGEIGVRSDDEVDGGYGPLNTVDEQEKRVGEDDAGEGNRLRVTDADNKSGGLEKEEGSTRAFGPRDGSYWEDAEDAAFRRTAQEENKGSAYGARGAEVRRADDGLRLGRERDSSKIEAMQEPKDVGVDRRARSQSLRTRRRRPSSKLDGPENDVSSAPATLRRNRGDGSKFDGEPKRWEKDGIYFGRPDGVSSSLAGGAEADLPVDDDDEGLGVGEGRVQSTEHVDAQDKDADDSSDDRPYDVSGSRIGGRMEARDRSFSRSINLPRVSRGQSGAGGLRKDVGKGNGGRMRSREAAKRAGQGNDRLSDERSGHRLSRLSVEPGGAAALSRGDEMNVVQGKRVRGRKGPAVSRDQVETFKACSCCSNARGGKQQVGNLQASGGLPALDDVTCCGTVDMNVQRAKAICGQLLQDVAVRQQVSKRAATDGIRGGTMDSGNEEGDQLRRVAHSWLESLPGRSWQLFPMSVASSVLTATVALASFCILARRLGLCRVRSGNGRKYGHYRMTSTGINQAS